MLYRHVIGFLVATVALTAGAVTLPAEKWAPARTADGHPDFQGVWANNTVTPLQRPKQWEGKTRLTDAEIAELQKVAAKITENDGDAQFGDGFILAVLNGIEKPNSYAVAIASTRRPSCKATQIPGNAFIRIKAKHPIELQLCACNLQQKSAMSTFCK